MKKLFALSVLLLSGRVFGADGEGGKRVVPVIGFNCSIINQDSVAGDGEVANDVGEGVILQLVLPGSVGTGLTLESGERLLANCMGALNKIMQGASLRATVDMEDDKGDRYQGSFVVDRDIAVNFDAEELFEVYEAREGSNLSSITVSIDLIDDKDSGLDEGHSS